MFEIKSKDGHYELYYGGQFYTSHDTMQEAMEEMRMVEELMDKQDQQDIASATSQQSIDYKAALAIVEDDVDGEEDYYTNMDDVIAEGLNNIFINIEMCEIADNDRPYILSVIYTAGMIYDAINSILDPKLNGYALHRTCNEEHLIPVAEALIGFVTEVDETHKGSKLSNGIDAILGAIDDDDELHNKDLSKEIPDYLIDLYLKDTMSYKRLVMQYVD